MSAKWPGVGYIVGYEILLGINISQNRSILSSCAQNHQPDVGLSAASKE